MSIVTSYGLDLQFDSRRKKTFTPSDKSRQLLGLQQTATPLLTGLFPKGKATGA